MFRPADSERDAHPGRAPTPSSVSLLLPPSVGVYVHVPWCRSKCDYCAFVSQPLCDRITKTPRPIVDEVMYHSVALLERRLEFLGRPAVTTVYIGGGTPTALGPRRLDQFLGAIRGLMGEGVEWSVEANPRSLAPETIAVCRKHGVTRISLGVQSFQPRILQSLGRESASNLARVLENLKRAVERTRSAGRPLGWSLDLMTGVLDMSLLEAVDDAERAVALAPDHISLYDLSVEAGTALARRLGPRGARRFADRATEVSAAARRILMAGGYHRYEISAYCRPGGECLHNRGYWRMQPFVGAGPSAVSSLSRRDGSIVRFSDPPGVEEFLAMRDPWGTREHVSVSRAAFERVMLGLRTDEGTTRSALPPAVVDGWLARGFADIQDEDRVVMTEAGWEQLDPCLRELSSAWDEPP